MCTIFISPGFYSVFLQSLLYDIQRESASIDVTYVKNESDLNENSRSKSVTAILDQLNR